MDLDLETCLVALYVIVDDFYQSQIKPCMPACGGPPAQRNDSEVLCLGLGHSGAAVCHGKVSAASCVMCANICSICFLPRSHRVRSTVA
jgi:hypothetical protein